MPNCFSRIMGVILAPPNDVLILVSVSGNTVLFSLCGLKISGLLLQLATLEGENHEVTLLSASPDKLHLAVGYADGAIRIFNVLTGEVAVTFSGHKSAVTALNYDHDGLRLVSGSRVS